MTFRFASASRYRGGDTYVDPPLAGETKTLGIPALFTFDLARPDR